MGKTHYQVTCRHYPQHHHHQQQHQLCQHCHHFGITGETAVLQNSLQLELLRICQTRFRYDSYDDDKDGNDDDDDDEEEEDPNDDDDDEEEEEDGNGDDQMMRKTDRTNLLDRCVRRAVPTEVQNSKLQIFFYNVIIGRFYYKNYS